MPGNPIIDKLQTYLDKHPDATDDEVARDIPELSDTAKRHAAFGYVHGLSQGNAPSRMDRQFPEFAPQTQTQQVDLKNSPEVHGSMPTSQVDNNTPSVTPPLNDYKTVADKHVAKVRQAQNDRADAINKYNTDDVIKHLNAQQLRQTQGQLETAVNKNAMTMDDFKNKMAQAYQNFLISNDHIDKIKAEIPNNPEMQNHLIDAASEIYPDKAGDLQKMKYLTNRAQFNANGTVAVPDNAAQINSNADNIGKGKYKLVNGQVIRPMDPVESFMSSVKNSVDSRNHGDWLIDAKDEDVANYYINKNKTYNPDEPVGVPSSNPLSFGADLAGSLVPISAKQALFSTIAGKLPVVGPVVGPALGAIAGADDMRKQTYGQIMDQHMQNAIANGEDPLLAVKDARKHAVTGSMVDFAAMTAMGGIPETKLFHEPIPLTPGVSGLVKHVTTKIGQELAEKTPAAAASALLLGGGQIIKNHAEGKEGNDLYEGVSNQMAMGGGLHYMTALLSPLMEDKVPTKMRDAILQNMHKVPGDVQDKVFEDLQRTGSMSPDDVSKVKADIADRGAVDNLIDPRVVNDEDRVKIANKIETLNKARERLKTLDKSYNDEAAKQSIKDKEDEIRTLTNESISKSKDIHKTNTDAAKSVAAEDIGPEHEQQFSDEIKKQNEINSVRSVRGQGDEAQSDNGSDVTPSGTPEAADNKERVQSAGKAEGTGLNGGQASDRNAETIKPNSDKIKPTPDYRTADIGNHEGQQEFKLDDGKLNKDDDHQTELKKQQVENIQKWNIPLDAGTKDPHGETMQQFVGRVISRYKNDKDTSPNNTAIIAHSSVLKTIKTYEELQDKPEFKNADWNNLDEKQHKEFTDAYVKESTNNGDIETYDSASGKIHIVRHGQTEDNKTGKFRDNQTPLTDKGEKQAAVAGDELKDKGDIPQIITSDLPRAVHTANIINDKLGDTDGSTIHEKALREINALAEKYKNDSEYVRRTQTNGEDKDQARARARLSTEHFNELSPDVQHFFRHDAEAMDFENPDQQRYKGIPENRISGSHIASLEDAVHNIQYERYERNNKSNPISNPDEWESMLKSEIDKTRSNQEPSLAKHGETGPATKPNIELDRIKDEDILKKDRPRDIRKEQNEILKRHSVLKSILDCL